MNSWENITDEEMRGHVLDGLRSKLSELTRYAKRSELEAQDMKRPYIERERERTFAAYNRRAARHVQQAIDLLTAAPMPPKEGS